MTARAHAAVQRAPTSPVARTPLRSGLLQRKCACGGAAGFSGRCEECGKSRLTPQHTPYLDSGRGNGTARSDLPVSSDLQRLSRQPHESIPQELGTTHRGPDFAQTKIFPNPQSAADRATSFDGTKGERLPGGFDGKALPFHRELPLPLPLDLRGGHRNAALDALVANLDSGELLSTSDRQSLQPLSPVPLDDIRIHDSRESRITADLLNSEAFTVGNDIVLGNAAAADPARGRWLLAHEVAHAVQQHSPAPDAHPESRVVANQPEREADRFADAATARSATAIPARVPLSPTQVGLARKVIWKYIQDLPGNLLLIIDVDDGGFIGGCVRAYVPHMGVKLISKNPHTELFNVHIGYMTNAAGQFCIFFYESVSRICETKCFPSREELNLDEVMEWIKEMIEKVITVLAIAVLIAAAAFIIFLIAEAIAAALAVLLALAAA